MSNGRTARFSLTDFFESAYAWPVILSACLSVVAGIILYLLLPFTIPDELIQDMFGSNLTLSGTLIAVMTIVLAVGYQTMGNKIKRAFAILAMFLLAATCISTTLVALSFLYQGVEQTYKSAIASSISLLFMLLIIMTVVGTIEVVIYIIKTYKIEWKKPA